MQTMKVIGPLAETDLSMLGPKRRGAATGPRP